MNSPIITPEFLSWLEGIFPDRVPRMGDSVELYRVQGEQRVLDKLRAEHRLQLESTSE